MNSTVRRLADLTDEGAFELLATAVLRESRPEYAALVHSGVNAAGKTVKSPLDGVCFAPGSKPRHMIAVHHTTSRREDLHKKWLLDPTTKKSQRGKKAPTREGDVVKTARVFAQERAQDPTLRATLVLTTNQEPAEDVVRAVNFLASTHGIEVDLWSASRLAHVLDNSPTGQWIRRQYLGIEQQLISREQLAELCSRSLRLLRPSSETNYWVERALDGTISEKLRGSDVVFVVGESGVGKTVACVKHLTRHIAEGGFALAVTHEVVTTSPTIERAIETTLFQLAPQLLSPGESALGLCAPEHPLVILVEDVNLSAQPQALVDRLLGWGGMARGGTETAANSNAPRDRSRWRIVCPVWPRIVHALSHESGAEVLRNSVVATSMSNDEGCQAVMRRARGFPVRVTEADASSISQSLGNDPLLIALYPLEERPPPIRLLELFIDASVRRLASQRREHTASEYRAALRALASALLFHGEMRPDWPDVVAWTSDSETTTLLRHLVHAGDIIQLSDSTNRPRVLFRHDRVRDALLADAIAEELRQNSAAGARYRTDPHFADVLGVALASDGVPVSVLDEIKSQNPAALFHALGTASQNAQLLHAVLRAINEWLDAAETHDDDHWPQRRDAMLALLRAPPSEVVRQVAGRFRDNWFPKWQVLLRSGDIVGGLNLCLRAEPGVGAPWRDQSLEDARVRMLPQVTRALDALLGEPTTPTNHRVAALRWAGYLGDACLGAAIERSWQLDAKRVEHLEDYLWAAARCCGDEPARLLDPVCSAWAALPEEAETPGGRSPRNSLAADHVRWAFSSNTPDSAIRYFLDRAKNEDLSWPLMYMLHSIDHPDAVEAVARELGRIAHEIEGTPRVSMFSNSVRDAWRRRAEDGRPMSEVSRNRVLKIWTDQSNPGFLRQESFGVWAATVEARDVAILKEFATDPNLSDAVLWHRLKRKDESAIPLLLEKLKGDDRTRAYWWHAARFSWSTALDAALEEELRLRKSQVQAGANFATDHEIADIIFELELHEAESVLLRHWQNLRFTALFVQCALYVATPRLRNAVADSVAASSAPKELFRHLDMHYGIRMHGRTGVTRREQLEALAPYWDLMDDLTIKTFWDLCNDKGWFDLRREMLDPRLDAKYDRGFIDDDRTFDALDKMVSDGRTHWIHLWVDDFLKTGTAPEVIISKMGTWLSRRLDVVALRLVGDVVSYIGQRSDLPVMDVPVAPTDQADKIRAAASYSVRRRTLV